MLTEEGNLISTGASIIRATSNGDADSVRSLLAEGVAVDQRGRGGHTALMVAAIFGHVDIARLLLAAGADVHLKDNLGLTARDWADRRGAWEVAQLLSNASPAEIEPSPKGAPGKQTQLKVETERRDLATEPKTTAQPDANTSRSERDAEATCSTVATRPEAEDARQAAERDVPASATKPETAPEPDALRFLKFHKQIMAAQERRKAEQARLSEQGAVATWSSTATTRPEPEPDLQSSPIRTDSPQQDAPSLANLSEQRAVATWSSTAATRPEPEPDLLSSAVQTDSPQQDAPSLANLSEQRAVATWSSTATTRPEPEPDLLSSPIQTDSPQQRAEEQQITKAEPERGQVQQAQPTATQLARIAATIEHLRLLEESSLAGDIAAKSEEAAPTAGERGLDSSDDDITIERRPDETATQPAMFKPKTSVPLDSPAIKRCPQCDTTYENPLLMYCAYDATKLISADDSMFSYAAPRDRSRQTLWALIAIVTVFGASIGYLINNYRSKEKVPTAPVAATASVPVATQTEPPDTIRNDSPLITGDLSGMEVDVPEPEYPSQARAEGVSGTVTVRVQVNQKGRVVLARSSRGDWRLRAAAVQAAQKATFSPEKLAAHGKVISGNITYNFVAEPKSPAATGSEAATTSSPSANGSPTAGNEAPTTGSSAENASGDYPAVGGPLVGAESNLPEPDYPKQAKAKGISGTITVVVRVNRAGKVISWRTLEGDSQLRAAALKAAKKATFSPAKLPGNGEVVGSITYNFK